MSAATDWMSTILLHMAWSIVRIYNACLKCVARGSLQMQDPKKVAPPLNFVWLYLRNYGAYRQSEKKLVKQQYLPCMSPTIW